MRRANRPRAAKNSAIELSIRLDLPGIGHVGPGKIELLKQIREHRSISAAARAMDMSYRRAWLLVQDLNDVFVEPVVAKWLGGTSRGGAQLTEAGERLVANYEAIVQKAVESNRGVLNEILRSARRREVSRSSAS